MIRNMREKNTNWKRVCGGLLSALLIITLASCSSQGNNANNTTATGTPTPTPNTAATNANANTPTSDASFREAAMTWGHVEEARAELDGIIKESDLEEVHETAVKIRDSVDALPGKSEALPADKRETLNSRVKEVGRLAGMLGEAGDSTNTDAVREHHKLMNEALDTIKNLYPAGIMPDQTPKDDKMHDKGMHGADKRMGEMPKKKGGMKMPMNDH